jgi:hypothetical protein
MFSKLDIDDEREREKLSNLSARPIYLKMKINETQLNFSTIKKQNKFCLFEKVWAIIERGRKYCSIA